MPQPLTVTDDELGALIQMGARFTFREFEPVGPPQAPGPVVGRLCRLTHGVEFVASWPRRPHPEFADQLPCVRKAFATWPKSRSGLICAAV